MKRVEEIVDFAVQLRDYFGTNNPYKIAEYYGVEVREHIGADRYRAAYAIRADGYPMIISIANGYSEKAKKILCAHELGHVLLHGNGYNSFDVTSWNLYSTVEYEANIFAMALLAGEKALEQIKELDPYTVKKHLDKKIVKEEIR